MQPLPSSGQFTSDTIFANTKLPLTIWFLAMYFLTQQKNGISALQLKRHLGVAYPTAWSLKHKLMQVMKETDDRRPLNGVVQLDDVYWGGQRRGTKSGRGSPNKVPFVAAVATDLDGHPIAMRMSKVNGFRKREIAEWTIRHVHPDAIVVSDALVCFDAVTEVGREHYSVVTGGGPTSVTLDDFTWVNTMIGNVKNALTGTTMRSTENTCRATSRNFATASTGGLGSKPCSRASAMPRSARRRCLFGS